MELDIFLGMMDQYLIKQKNVLKDHHQLQECLLELLFDPQDTVKQKLQKEALVEYKAVTLKVIIVWKYKVIEMISLNIKHNNIKTIFK